VQPREPDISLDLDHQGDVVEFGGPPRRPVDWRRWALPVVLLLAVAVVGAVALRSRGDRPSAAASPSPASPSPAPTASASPLNSTDNSPGGTQVGHPLLGVTANWELFARNDTQVVRVELAAGRVTWTPVPGLASGGPVSFLALPDSVLVRPLDFVPGYRIKDGQPAALLGGALNLGGPVLPGPRPGTVWVALEADSRISRLQLVDADGASVGKSVTLPGNADPYPYPDGSGNILAMGVGGVYSLGPGGAQRVSTGRLVATGPTRWVTQDCDDQARCSLVVIDKSSGSKRSLPNAPIPVSYTIGVISPDGRTAAFVNHLGDGSAPSIVLMLDLNTGQQLPFSLTVDPQYDESGILAWSPDSRWLFCIDQSGVVHAVDPATGQDHDLGVTLPRVKQLTIRPPH
jgi:hypothetical protein